MPLTESYLYKWKTRFLEIPTVCSEIKMSYLFSKLRKGGMMNIKKIIMICSVIVSFPGLV
jgi:hypothetical protein